MNLAKVMADESIRRGIARAGVPAQDVAKVTAAFQASKELEEAATQFASSWLHAHEQVRT